MSDTFWVAMVTGLPAFIAALVAAWIAVSQRQELKIAKDTHTLVNSNMGVQLSLNAGNARRIASITRDPKDVQAADLAERMLREHEEKQAVVDGGK